METVKSNIKNNNNNKNNDDSNNDNDNPPATSMMTISIIGKGSDSDGKIVYETPEEMWTSFGISAGATREVINENWYNRAADWYEEHCPPTVNGVLGGFANISEIDLAGSKLFLEELQEQWSMVEGQACECGAGIGRVTKGLLLDLPEITQVDLVESSSRLLFESPDYIGEDGAAKCRFFCTGLQDWNVPPGRYSLIWIQWVLIYLTDEDCIAFLKRCAEGLKEEGGIIVIKENTCGGGDTFVVDTEDASVCRSLEYWLQLVKAAGLTVIYQKMQTDFPNDIFPVPMLALVPTKRINTDSEESGDS